jgi:hypothetical protein
MASYFWNEREACEANDPMTSQRRETPQRFFVSVPFFVSTAHGLLGAENRKRLPFAVAGYPRYKRNPFGIERAHNMVAQVWNYRADFIFKRRDLIGGSILEVNCD